MTGVSVGSTVVRAALDGVSGSAAVQVKQQTVASIALAPSGSASVPVGQTLQLTATVLDAQGLPIVGMVIAYASSNASVATVSGTGLVTALAQGTTTITATVAGKSASVKVTVVAAGAGTSIVIDPSTTYQTITSWEGVAQIGQVECPAAFPYYKTEVLDRAINELGLNGLQLNVQSGAENRSDYFAQWLNRSLNEKQFNDLIYQPTNDNVDPFSADPTGFQWSEVDHTIDNVIEPARHLMALRGEKLWVRATWIDNKTTLPRTYFPTRVPDEYAEFILELWKHIQTKYGWTPDALEVILEPDNTYYNASEIGADIVKVGARLAAAGYRPRILAPSVSTVTGSPKFYDTMVAVPGVLQYLTDFTYHRYDFQNGTNAALQQIVTRAQRDHLNTGMVEFNQTRGIDDLWNDLTVGNNSMWDQYSTAFCLPASGDHPETLGPYFQLNVSTPTAPRVNITNNSKLFRQIFLFVRAGAVRLGATSGAPSSVGAMAFRNTNGKYVAIVRAISGGATFSVNGLPAGKYGIKYATSAQWDIDLPDQTISSGGAITTSIPAAGLLTIYAR